MTSYYPQTITDSSKTNGIQESWLFQLQVSSCCFSRSFYPSCAHSLTSGIPRIPCTQNLLQQSKGKQSTFHHIIHKKSAKDHEAQPPSSSAATPFLHLLSLQQLQQWLHWDPRKLISLEIQHSYIGWPTPFLQFSPCPSLTKSLEKGHLTSISQSQHRKATAQFCGPQRSWQYLFLIFLLLRWCKGPHWTPRLISCNSIWLRVALSLLWQYSNPAPEDFLSQRLSPSFKGNPITEESSW